MKQTIEEKRQPGLGRRLRSPIRRSAVPTALLAGGPTPCPSTGRHRHRRGNRGRNTIPARMRPVQLRAQVRRAFRPIPARTPGIRRRVLRNRCSEKACVLDPEPSRQGRHLRLLRGHLLRLTHRRPRGPRHQILGGQAVPTALLVPRSQQQSTRLLRHRAQAVPTALLVHHRHQRTRRPQQRRRRLRRRIRGRRRLRRRTREVHQALRVHRSQPRSRLRLRLSPREFRGRLAVPTALLGRPLPTKQLP